MEGIPTLWPPERIGSLEQLSRPYKALRGQYPYAPGTVVVSYLLYRPKASFEEFLVRLTRKETL